ncbi:MAG: prepilin-type N-terminal cleavage/methylation domain-containing protein [Myxococcaceae bacterium]|jgi:type IV pilus assembly protein PilA|nr:prepilin-type N-terminal cleavage/methylation domain-containing protein [Myxococcaceae bacterium]
MEERLRFRRRLEAPGFTLIELMIVVAIIGILAAIAIPNFVRFQAKGKQSEVNANLKAIFTAQKASYPHLQGYWSDVGGIGFTPERGNRYLYDLGPVAGSVGLGTEGSCGQFVDRALVPPTVMAGDCGLTADVARHGASFTNPNLLALMQAGQVPAAFSAEVAGNANLTMAGVNGASCPNCDFAAVAISNVDNDVGADVWWVSSQTLDQPGVVGCPPAMTLALMNAFTSGTPTPVVDDVCYDGQ